MDTVTYKGKEFPVRDILLSKQQGYRRVAQVELEDAITTVSGRIRSDAEEIDTGIWYYCDKEEWSLDDRSLIKRITKHT